MSVFDIVCLVIAGIVLVPVGLGCLYFLVGSVVVEIEDFRRFRADGRAIEASRVEARAAWARRGA